MPFLATSGCCGSDGSGIRCNRLGFGADGDDVGDGCVFGIEELDRAGVRQVADANCLMQAEIGDIDIDVAGNVAGEALDFDFAQDQIEHAALVLDADGNADEPNRNAGLHGLVHGDALEVDVQQRVANRLILPVDDHGLGDALAGDVHVEDGVVAGLGVQDAQNLLGVDFDGDRLVARAINDGGNLAGDANLACGILVELAIGRHLAGLGYDDFRHCCSLFFFGHGLCEAAPFVDGQ